MCHATQHTAAYITTIVDEEQPDWAPPDNSAVDADPETGDEAASGGGGDGEADAAAAEEGGDNEEGADGDADGGGEGGNSSGSAGPPNYSAKLLRYVAASVGQEFMTALELRRRAEPPQSQGGDGSEGEGGQQQAEEPVPVTFRILDEHMPLLEVRGVQVRSSPQHAKY
jgi:hypothetical protein